MHCRAAQTSVCKHTQGTHTGKWGRSEMLWSVGVIQRKQQRKDRLELGCSTTPRYTRGNMGTRTCAWLYSMCTLAHSRTYFVKWQSRNVRGIERGESAGKMIFFFLSFARLSSEKVHVLKMFSSDKQAYLSLVIGVCLPWQDEFAAKSGFKFTACRALTRHP